MKQPTCVVEACQAPTDTVLHFQGNGMWLVAGLMTLDIPEEPATFMISKLLECSPNEVFDKWTKEDLVLYVCPKCAKNAKYPPPARPGMPIPIIAQPH